jgi:pantoate kinase
MPADKKSEERVRELALELQKVLRENLLKDPEEAQSFMEQAREIRREIGMMGYLVEWRAKLDPESLRLSVVVSVFKPKENLSPELQKIYDEWFTRTTGIRNPQSE